MTPYKNIVLAYDDSRFSRAALVETLHYAQQHGSKVTIVHAVFFDSEEFSISPGRIDERLQRGRDACERAVDEYSRGFDVDINYLIRQGEPHEVITTVADELGADLIAMGTHGRKGVRKMFMGSVTASVIAEAPCDVLVVKKECEECNGEYHNVLVPFDNSELSRKAVIRVGAIANSHEMATTILYVIPRYEEMIGFMRTESVEERMRDEADKIVLAGEKIASDNGISANTAVEEGSAAEEIIAKARGLGSDLIVLGSHGWRGLDRTILGSTAERVITFSPVPVLVVR